MRVLVWGIVATLAMIAGSTAGPLDSDALDADSMAWFYNRTGVTVEQHAADLSACARLGGALTSGGATYGPSANLVGDALFAIQGASKRRSIMDDCMMWRGYRRFDVRGESLRNFNARAATIDASAESPIIASETPPIGVLARVWDNDYWYPSVSDPTISEPPLVRQIPDPVRQDRIEIIRSTRDVPNLQMPEGHGVVIGRTRIPTGERSSGLFLIFDRVDPSTGLAHMRQVGRRTVQPVFYLRPPNGTPAAYEGAYEVAVVPEGFYRLAGAGIDEFCLHSPGFPVRAGHVVSVGDVIVTSPRRRRQNGATIQIRIEPGDIAATQIRAGLPSELARRLESASWYNGLATTCNPGPRMDDQFVYGLVLPGAPSIQEYLRAID